MTRTSLLAHVIERAAEALAADSRIPAPARVAFQQHAAHVLRVQFAAMVGGERIYAPKLGDVERAAREQRIQQALAAGEPTRLIARRERVSERWVRALRARGGSAAP
ncbi:MAG: hypothetical protein IPM99_18745 [Rubrivivax sp.]|nr:hypothetical protein [Rubrivivax sp.]